ncbi:PaaI family thioesterase [Kordia jejudonensis]|uniref:PaaI family thioesterase n=1 Tax=Kordia jejudonensis TaxID=1348245 RepID=UPI000629828F|nr:hotdog fold thioesterase [Kordia jejudonensis]
MNLEKEEILKQLNGIVPNTLLETLQISYTDVGENYLTAKMPVNSSVHQPQGLLHGGATVALAETVGSTASHLFIDPTKFKVKGLEISANHLKSKRDGEVFATARPIHKGRTTHLWEIKVVDEEGTLISLCKLTTIVLPK